LKFVLYKTLIWITTTEKQRKYNVYMCLGSYGLK